MSTARDAPLRAPPHQRIFSGRRSLPGAEDPMEVPSSSPVYTPLKLRPRRVVADMEPVTLFPREPSPAEPEPRRSSVEPEPALCSDEPKPERRRIEPAVALAVHEESVVRSSDDEGSDADASTTLAALEEAISSGDEPPTDSEPEDEPRWSFAQRPPPEAVVEDSMLEAEPLELSALASSANDGDETVLSDDDDAQHTDSDTTAVGILDASQGKSTQNYLSELLTDSLLESLPLPPERKRHLREVAR